MSNRNFILLMIVLAISVAGIWGFLYLRQAATVPTDDGSDTNFISQFNPFGDSKPTTTPPVEKPPVEVNPYQTPTAEEIQNMKLLKVSSMPIAGFTVFTKERLKEIPAPDPALTAPTTPPEQTETPAITKVIPKTTKTTKPVPPPTEFVPALRYVERATGNVYQTFVDKVEERKFSDTTIPKVYDAYFGNHGNTVLMRYLKRDEQTIETFLGTLPKEYLGGDTVSNNEIKGVFLPENVRDISLSPDTNKIFYLFNSGDSVIGTTLDLLTNKKVQVFSSVFTEWLSWWGSGSQVTLSTKPASDVLGYMYTLDLNKKSFTKTLGEISGLTTLGSPNGKSILYSNSNLYTSVYHADRGTATVMGIRTLPDKCVWSKVGDTLYCAVPKIISPSQYPDAWYRGEVSFDDQIWKIDAATGNASILLDPSQAKGGEAIDATKLALDEKENYLFFINKKDSYLWKFDLN